MTPCGSAPRAESDREIAVTAVVLARDEEEMLPGCLRSLRFADEVVVAVDSRSADRTAEIATASGATILTLDFRDFGSAKQEAHSRASSPWILSVDADERVSPELAREIRSRLAAVPDDVTAYRLAIGNVFYGHKMNHGGWASEAPIRLFRAGSYSFSGAVHERAQSLQRGQVECLRSPLVHLSHRSVEQCLSKDWQYVNLGALDLYGRNAPPVTTRTMLRRASKLFLRRFVWKRAWKDGPAGVAEHFRLLGGEMATLLRLWEMQSGYDPVRAYEEIDAELASHDTSNLNGDASPRQDLTLSGG